MANQDQADIAKLDAGCPRSGNDLLCTACSARADQDCSTFASQQVAVCLANRNALDVRLASIGDNIAIVS